MYIFVHFFFPPPPLSHFLWRRLASLYLIYFLESKGWDRGCNPHTPPPTTRPFLRFDNAVAYKSSLLQELEQYNDLLIYLAWENSHDTVQNVLMRLLWKVTMYI